ncbi:hypothetical protein BGX26_007630 [Mortierella sp. AD094]|nr:hypothetical protein BGX26_007630 [Mortierella sp. AD094]
MGTDLLPDSDSIQTAVAPQSATNSLSSSTAEMQLTNSPSSEDKSSSSNAMDFIGTMLGLILVTSASASVSVWTTVTTVSSAGVAMAIEAATSLDVFFFRAKSCSSLDLLVGLRELLNMVCLEVGFDVVWDEEKIGTFDADGIEKAEKAGLEYEDQDDLEVLGEEFIDVIVEDIAFAAAFTAASSDTFTCPSVFEGDPSTVELPELEGRLGKGLTIPLSLT